MGSNDNGVGVNFATSQNLIVVFLKYIWTSPDGKTHNQIHHVLIHKRRHSNIVNVQSFGLADCDTDHYLVIAKVRDYK